MLAVKGCAEIISEISMDFDIVCCPCGTGGTLAGLIAGLNGRKSALGFSVLKGMKDMEEKVEAFVTGYSNKKYTNWKINHDYHFGGFAKQPINLIEFIRDFNSRHNIPLDPVYTGKMMFGIYDLFGKNYFSENTTIVTIHTGGIEPGFI